ncbi:MAG: hypothetical protein A2V88_12320 [Elusimicrobia bacterium RBG_16_66_12]|nr:MAG: hypothetical protein A2V88_12320 [Elusimicrobia bacterium RBG_16_66_12]
MAAPERVTTTWLAGMNACGPEFDAFRQHFGDGLEVTWAAFDAAEAQGLNLIWLGLRLLPPSYLPEFVALTIAERRGAVRSLGGDALASASDLRAASAGAWERWQETGDHAQRSLAIALRDLAGDLTLAPMRIGAQEAERAVRHCLRAVSMAELEEGPVRRRLCEWMAEKIMGPRPGA